MQRSPDEGHVGYSGGTHTPWDTQSEVTRDTVALYSDDGSSGRGIPTPWEDEDEDQESEEKVGGARKSETASYMGRVGTL